MKTKSITAQDPALADVMAYQYTHDRMDNILSKDTEHGNYVYGYDDVYRLVSADNPAIDDENYTYDDVGNRLTSATYDDWQYNSNNELLAYNGVSFEYDDNGNMIQKTKGTEVMNFIYDVDNRLVRIEDESSSVIAEYYYDPFGRRIFKEVSGTRTYFLYADEGLVGEYNNTGIEIKIYGYKPDSTWTTDPVFMKENRNYYFYHNDHLGTPIIMTDISGNLVWSAMYNSFGKAEVQPSSTIENNLRFPGQYYDTETGLHYNWYRYYDPAVGRYLTTDPIKFLGGDINLYIYVGNNPVNFIDPYGLINWRDLIPTDPGKVIGGIALQFSGYILMGTAGLVVWAEGPLALLDPGIGGMAYIGGFVWWQGTKLIYQGYSELPPEKPCSGNK